MDSIDEIKLTNEEKNQLLENLKRKFDNLFDAIDRRKPCKKIEICNRNLKHFIFALAPNQPNMKKRNKKYTRKQINGYLDTCLNFLGHTWKYKKLKKLTNEACRILLEAVRKVLPKPPVPKAKCIILIGQVMPAKGICSEKIKLKDESED